MAPRGLGQGSPTVDSRERELSVWFWNRKYENLLLESVCTDPSPRKREGRKSAAMDVTQEPDGDPRSLQEHGSLLVLALLAFAVGGTSGLVGAVFRLVLDQSDRFRGMVVDWAHGNQIAGFACVIGILAIATGLAAWLVRKFAPGAKGSGIPDVEAVLRDEQPPPPLILIPVKFLGGVLAWAPGSPSAERDPPSRWGRVSVIFLPPCAAVIKMMSRHSWPQRRPYPPRT